jgi:hypothetical protein
MTLHQTRSRRSVLRALGATAAAATLGSTAAAATDPDWTTAETPTDNALHGVARASDGTYAVGGGGVVLRRTDDGWTRVLAGGPTGNGNNLYGADVTDDGRRLWFVGASGAIGEYHVETGMLVDHSAPMDVTNNFNGVAATGTGGAANVYVAGDSGTVYRSFENGATGTWDDVTPGSGAAVEAVDFFGPRAGAVVDGNQSVFRTDDGATWDRVGVADANHSFDGVDADGPGTVRVAAGGGTLLRRDGSRWRRTSTGDADLRDVEVAGDAGLAVGAGGAVYAHDGSGWTREPTPTGANLRAVVRGSPDVAVGAGGTVVERD